MPTLYPWVEPRPLPSLHVTSRVLRMHAAQLRQLDVHLDQFWSADDIVRSSMGTLIWQAARDACLLDESPFIELLLEKESRRDLVEALAANDGADITDALLECLADDAFDETRFIRLRQVA